METKKDRSKKGKIRILLILLALALSLESCWTAAELAGGLAMGALTNEHLTLSNLEVKKQEPDVLIITGKVEYKMAALAEKKKFVDISRFNFVFTLSDRNHYQIGRVYGKPELEDKKYTLSTFPVDTVINFKISQEVEPLIWKNAAVIKDWEKSAY